MKLRPFLLLGMLLLAACSKVTQSNYDKLSAGMSKAEVEALLGSPRECSGALGMLSCRWGDETRYISVQYAGERVMLFSGHNLP